MTPVAILNYKIKLVKLFYYFSLLIFLRMSEYQEGYEGRRMRSTKQQTGILSRFLHNSIDKDPQPLCKNIANYINLKGERESRMQH